MGSTRDTAEPVQGRPDGRIGRRIGIGVFWLSLVYVIGMSAASIIPSLYWPEAAPRPAAKGTYECARELEALKAELLDRAARTLRRGEARRLEPWLAAWDQRLLGLAGGCGPLEDAREDLVELRHGIESLLAGYRGAPLRASERIERALQALPPRDDAGARPKI